MKKIIFLLALISSSSFSQEEAYRISGLTPSMFDNYLPRIDGIFINNIDYSVADEFFSVSYLPKNGNGGWKRTISLPISYYVQWSNIKSFHSSTDIVVSVELAGDGLPNRCFVMRMTESGDIVWTKIINYGSVSTTYSITPNALVVNEQDEITLNVSLYEMLLVTKLSNNGNIIFSKRINSLNNPEGKNPGFSVMTTDDGGYILTMKEGSHPTITKLNSSLQVEWAKEWAIDSYSHPKLIAPFPNGNYCIVGEGDNGTFIVEMDPLGNVLSYKFGMYLNYPYAFNVLDNNHVSIFDYTNRKVDVNLATDQMSNTTYTTDVYGVITQSNQAYNLLDQQHGMIYLNVQGNQMGCFSETVYESGLSTFPFVPDSISNTLIVLSDVGTIANYYPMTHFFVGTVSLEQTCSYLSVEEAMKSTLSVFPNPTASGNSVAVQFENTNGSKLQLISVSGNIVESHELSATVNEIQLTSLQQAGMYFVQLLDNNGNVITVEKLVIE